ncbi:phage major capsid protein, P2 family [Aeromonas aquatica]|uniref:phage major capsid protein, P2 family n=1 Tax=Aeromonas aquatica TaxID=558964 RepID=UPI00286F5162|nr:phage major capsid protein, P2 family [Aeromonas aquatica]
MRHKTRQQFEKYTAQLAKLNAITSALHSFAVEPSVQQTLETKMQESVAFLGMISVIPVDELKGEKVGIGISSTIASRTDTSGGNERQPIDPTALQAKGYECFKTNYDTAISYTKLDAWAKFDDFQIRVRDAIIQRQGLDRIMVGWNGTSAAPTTDRVANPMLQDVNIGWIEKTRQEQPTQIMSEGAAGSGQILIDKLGDYVSLDALVYDLVNSLIAPWHADDTELVVIVGRKLLSDKYFSIINDSDDNLQVLAGEVLMSKKQLGGLKALRVPYMPDDTLVVTKLANLSIYWQEDGRRRQVEDEPRRDRIVNWESSNDAYVVEDYDCIAIAENIVMGAPQDPAAQSASESGMTQLADTTAKLADATAVLTSVIGALPAALSGKEPAAPQDKQ